MTTYTLYWISEDGQSEINMGTFNTPEEAEDGKLAAEIELIVQCGEQEQLDKIVAGWWGVIKNKEG